MGSRYKRGTSPKNQDWMDLVSACPESSGVYFVWAGNELLYVGSSVKLRERLVIHDYKDTFRSKGVTNVTWAEFWSGNMLEVEKWLIEKYRPSINHRHIEVEVPEGQRICIVCHHPRPIYCFGVNSNPKKSRCMQCGKDAAAKYHIRAVGPSLKQLNDAKPKSGSNTYRSDTCFVCGEPSLRRVGSSGACRDHFKELAVQAKPGFAWRNKILEAKSAAIGDRIREMDSKDLGRKVSR